MLKIIWCLKKNKIFFDYNIKILDYKSTKTWLKSQQGWQNVIKNYWGLTLHAGRVDCDGL